MNIQTFLVLLCFIYSDSFFFFSTVQYEKTQDKDFAVFVCIAWNPSHFEQDF